MHYFKVIAKFEMHLKPGTGLVALHLNPFGKHQTSFEYVKWRQLQNRA